MADASAQEQNGAEHADNRGRGLGVVGDCTKAEQHHLMTAPLMLPPFQSIEFGPVQIPGANLWKSQMLGPHVSRICHTDVMSHLSSMQSHCQSKYSGSHTLITKKSNLIALKMYYFEFLLQ